MKILLSILTTLLFTSSIIGQTIISGGVIASNTIWTLSNSPYIIDGDIVLLTTKTLTIEPGVTIRVKDNVSLKIRGTLNAIGTSTDSILFTADSPNPTNQSWTGIILELGTANLDYCIGKYAEKFISNESNDICYIDNSHISNCLYGIYAVDGSSVQVIYNVVNSLFENCYFAIRGYWDFELSNSIIRNNQEGFRGSGAILNNNQFYNNSGIAVFASSSIITNNIIRNNGTGMNVNMSFSTITGNEISYNQTGWTITAVGQNSSSSVINNKFCYNTLYNVANSVSQSPDLSNNCWCTTITDTIEKYIYDVYENLSLGVVTYAPFNTCNLSTLIEDPNIQTDLPITVFPNPTSNQLNIKSKHNIREIIIIDITGKIVMTTKENTNTINVADLSNGIYFINLITGKKTITEKFVKQ